MKRKSNDKSRVKSIKRKVSAGFAVIAFILFFSSIVSLYEFTRMNRVLTEQIDDNVNSVNIGRDLIMLTEDYNLEVLNAISDYEGGEGALASGQIHPAQNQKFVEEFSQTMEEMRQSFTGRTTFSEKNYADSVLLAYTAYMQVLGEGRDIVQEDNDTRQEWYFERLQPFYLKLRNYIQSLTNASQEALIENSKKVDATFYRSITPAIASVVVGLLLVLLFNYFINFYLINPLIRISRGIQGYRSYKKNYNVEVDNNGDELDQLNNNVRDLIEDHKSVQKS
ncbi:MAG: hypothetical protein IIU16_05760 [Bacteroidales bacterium]|nr:hypothetical protein [Bacteroidales bacterium]MBQ5402401.1 hypothetical protein [Bacteroidales bacterium]